MGDSGVELDERWPLVCWVCGGTHAEPLASYRTTSSSVWRCAFCGDWPLLDTRDPGDLAALIRRHAHGQATSNQRFVAIVTFVSASVVVPIVVMLCQGVRLQLLLGLFLCGATTVGMLVAGYAMVHARRVGAPAFETRVRSGKRFVRTLVALVAAALLTVALPRLVSWLLPGPRIAWGDTGSREAQRLQPVCFTREASTRIVTSSPTSTPPASSAALNVIP